MALLRDSAASVFAGAAGAVLSFVSGVALARWLGPVGKGEYTLVVQFAALSGLVLSLGLGSSYLYHVQSRQLDRQVVIAHMWRQLGLLAIAVVAVGLLRSDALGLFMGPEVARARGWLALVLSFVVVAHTYAAMLLMSRPGGVATSQVIGVFGQALGVGLLVVLVRWGRFGVVGALLAFLVGMIARWLPALILATQTPAGAARSVLGYWSASRKLVPYGLKILLSNLLLSFVFRVDVFLLNYYASASAVGVYSVAVGFGELVLMVPTAIGVALFPHFAAAEGAERLRVLGRASRTTLVFAFVVSTVLFLAGRPLIITVYSHLFEPSVVALWLLLPGVVAMTVAIPIFNFLNSVGEVSTAAVVVGAGVIVNVAANVVLDQQFGARGAAVASTVAYVIIAVALIVIVTIRHAVPWRSLLLPTRSDVRDAARSVIALWDRGVSHGS